MVGTFSSFGKVQYYVPNKGCISRFNIEVWTMYSISSLNYEYFFDERNIDGEILLYSEEDVHEQYMKKSFIDKIKWRIEHGKRLHNIN